MSSFEQDIIDRKTIRDVWSFQARKYGFFVVFITGRKSNMDVKMESQLFGDILQLDLDDRCKVNI